MRFTFHGGANEVGRSCIEMNTTLGDFIFDCGIKVTPEGLVYPKKMDDLTGVKGVFLSHAHLDHTGALPMFKHSGSKAKIFCTKATARISDVLLNDSYQVDIIKHNHPAYTKFDIKSVEDQMVFVNYRKKYTELGLDFEFFNSGHIPGASSIKVHVDGTNVLYSGDINTQGTYLVKEADTDFGFVDILIVESTYGNRDHEERHVVEDKFVTSILNALRKGGSVVIPVFGVGRAQEVLMLLSKYTFDVPIYIDGMARKVTNLIVNNSTNLTDPFKVRNSYENAREVRNEGMREMVMKKRGIFITTSGMIEGGPVMSYMKRFHNDEHSAVLLTGYQCEGTNGRLLLDTGFCFIEGMKMKVKMNVEKFDFSAHAGKTQLHDLVKKVKPRAVIIQHGDPEAVKDLGDWCKKNTSCKVYMPSVGDSIEL